MTEDSCPGVPRTHLPPQRYLRLAGEGHAEDGDAAEDALPSDVAHPPQPLPTEEPVLEGRQHNLHKEKAGHRSGGGRPPPSHHPPGPHWEKSRRCGLFPLQSAAGWLAHPCKRSLGPPRRAGGPTPSRAPRSHPRAPWSVSQAGQTLPKVHPAAGAFLHPSEPLPVLGPRSTGRSMTWLTMPGSSVCEVTEDGTLNTGKSFPGPGPH